MLIYIIETPKDSLRLSLGLTVSCALSRLWYYCEPFGENHEWENAEKRFGMTRRCRFVTKKADLNESTTLQLLLRVKES